MGFGVQALRAARRALGDVPIVYTLHEYLPICANHGQMIKARTGALCSKASPSECGVCFPEIGPANLMRRELFLKSFLAEVDAFVSPVALPARPLRRLGPAAREAGDDRERPRRRAGRAAARAAAGRPAQPLRLLRPAQPVQGHPRAGRRGDAHPERRLGRLRSSTSSAATSSTSPRSSRPRSRSCSASPGGACASWAPTRAPTCRT